MSHTCKSCGAPIIWIETPNGKAHPVDAKPEKRWILENAVSEGPTGLDVAGVMVDTYTSHFATCPHAAKHRRQK